MKIISSNHYEDLVDSSLLLPIDVTDDSGHHSTEVQLLQHLSPEERQSVLSTAAAADVEDLEQFGRYSPLFKSDVGTKFQVGC